MAGPALVREDILDAEVRRYHEARKRPMQPYPYLQNHSFAQSPDYSPHGFHSGGGSPVYQHEYLKSRASIFAQQKRAEKKDELLQKHLDNNTKLLETLVKTIEKREKHEEKVRDFEQEMRSQIQLHHKHRAMDVSNDQTGLRRELDSMKAQISMLQSLVTNQHPGRGRAASEEDPQPSHKFKRYHQSQPRGIDLSEPTGYLYGFSHPAPALNHYNEPDSMLEQTQQLPEGTTAIKPRMERPMRSSSKPTYIHSPLAQA
jgi:hypothetical protein